MLRKERIKRQKEKEYMENKGTRLIPGIDEENLMDDEG